MTDMQDPALADIYSLQQSAPELFSPVRWRCGGWQIVLVEDGDLAGEYVGYEQAGRMPAINRSIVMTAVVALQRCRRLSPQEFVSLELSSSIGDVVSDDYELASTAIVDDFGFVLEPGAGYRRTVLTVANCALTYTWSPVAAFAWSKGLPGMGALGAAVDRARRLEGVGREG